MNSKGYLHELDGLRAIAVLMVLVNHLRSDWLPGGFVGVDVFFVLSGFVVTRSLLQRPSQGMARDLAGFYARRVVRILPALLVCVVITAACSVLLIPEAWLSQTLAKTGLWAVAGASNLALIRWDDGYFSARSDYNPFTHTWSLGVEEQFYLLVPVLVLLWMRGGAARRWLGWLLPALMVASLLLSAHWSTTEPNRAFYGLASRFWELAAGVALMWISDGLPKGRLSQSWGCWLGFGLIAAAALFSREAAHPWPGALLPVAGSVLLIAACGTPPASLPRWGLRAVLRSGAAAWLASISYALYLWHWPVIVLMRWTVGLESPTQVAVAASLSVALACASTFWLEQPLQRWVQQRKPSKRGVLLAGGGCVAMAAAVVQQGFAHQRQLSWSVVSRNSTDWLAEAPLAMGNSAKQRTVFVLGNSHGPAYAPMLQQVHEQLGWNIRIENMGACTVGQVIAAAPATPRCNEARQRVMARLDQEAKPGDLVLLASLRLQRFVDQWGPMDPPPASVIFGAQGRRERAEGLKEATQLIETLQAKGLVVMVDAPKPVLKAPPFRCSDWFNQQHPLCRGGASVSRTTLEQLRAPALDQLKQLQQRFPGLVVWDPFAVLCPGEQCEAGVGGKPLFFDADHLSGYGSRLLADNWIQTIHTRR